MADIGIGESAGIVALAALVIREVFGFLKTRGKNGTSGEKDPAYWREVFRGIVDNALREHGEIMRVEVSRLQAEIIRNREQLERIERKLS